WIKAIIDVVFNVPPGLFIPLRSLGVTGNFTLSEAPWWEIVAFTSEIAAEHLVLESKCSGKWVNSSLVFTARVLDNFHNPVILFVANGDVTITRNFKLGLGQW